MSLDKAGEGCVVRAAHNGSVPGSLDVSGCADSGDAAVGDDDDAIDDVVTSLGDDAARFNHDGVAGSGTGGGKDSKEKGGGNGDKGPVPKKAHGPGGC